MKSISRELVRELRWLRGSGAALSLLVTGALLAIAGVVSGATSSLAAISAFRDTLARYRENGEDVAAALAAPAVIEGDAAHQVISNSLRYDLDQAALALTQLSPIGAICSVLSLCALLVFPVLGYVLGVFLSTHDIRSGSVILRWPQSGIAPYATSKPIALVASLAALAAVIAAVSIPSAWIAGALVAPEVAELAAFAVDEPGAARAVAIGGLAVLTGTVFGALGLLVGAVTRNRTFSIGVFAVGFYLLPLAGVADPRNFLTLAGADVLYFAGQFRPPPLGEVPPLVAVGALLGGVVVALGLSLIPWATRSRTMSHG
jgi:hypothetical protein